MTTAALSQGELRKGRDPPGQPRQGRAAREGHRVPPSLLLPPRRVSRRRCNEQVGINFILSSV